MDELHIELDESVLELLRLNVEVTCRNAAGWRGCVEHRPEIECLADTYAEHTITLCSIVAETERLNAHVQTGRVTALEALVRTHLLDARYRSVTRSLNDTDAVLHRFHDAKHIGTA